MCNDLKQIGTFSPGVLPEALSAAQGKALVALLSGRPYTEAARAAGVSRTTIWRWLHEDAEFIAFYNSARQEMAAAIEQSVRRLSASAVATIRRLMTRRSVPDAVKFQAAALVLKIASGPVQGPTEVEDAKNAILLSHKSREMDKLRARCGVRDGDLLARLDRPIGRREQDEMAELDDGLDDEIDGHGPDGEDDFECE